MRHVPAVLIVLSTLLTGAKASAESVGPSFPCTPTPLDALARLACSDPSLALADIRMVQTYYALRRMVGPDGQNALKSQFLSFVVKTRQACGLPPVEPKRDQSEITLPATAAGCVVAAYDAQRVVWASKLSGPSAEEAARPPEQNTALQGKLKSLGFLPKDAIVDGVFGTGTRTALLAWQHATGRPETGFFDNADASVLMGDGSSPDPLAGLRSKPLAQAGYHGNALTIRYKDLQVALDNEKSHDPAVCQDSNGGSPSLGNSGPPQQTACRAVVAEITVDGKNVLTATAAHLDDPTDVDRLGLEVAIRRLDMATAQPQVVISSYTGGAHCCTSTVVATARADGTWGFVALGRIDGDQGFDFLDLTGDGSSLLVDVDDGFLYQFASYAGSYAPTRIRKLTGATLHDVTRDPHYRNLLLQQLRMMEQAEAQSGREQRNGYLAGWVAEKTLVGQLEEGWRVMLASYDHQATDGLSECAVDKRVWITSPYSSNRVCPDGENLVVAFPEALALFLTELGYITPEQSAALGYDPAKIETGRKMAMEMATARYEQKMNQRWFVITRAGDCVQAHTPASPAELIAADRATGLGDNIRVLEADHDGKPIVVRIGEPEGAGLISVLTFYRGLAKCEAFRQQQQNELENLK